MSRVSHTIENSSAMRVSIAEREAADARRLALLRRQPATRIEMKMMLSMPSTISSADNVTNAIQACGSESISTMANSAS